MKKLTAVVLAFIMSLSCMSPCFGADTTDINTLKDDNVTILTSLGITLPEEYTADDDITKEDFVYLMMKAANIPCGSQPEYLEFPDVKLDLWSHDAIVTARSLGYIAPKSDKSFGLNDKVSSRFAVDFAMKVLGFDKIGQMQYPGAYSNLVYACSNSEAISYSEAFDLIYTMLLCPYVDAAKYGTDGISYEVVTKRAFIENVFDVEKISGRLTGNCYSRIGGGHTDPDKIEIDGISYVSACGNQNENLGLYGEFFVAEDDSIKTIIAVKINEVNKEYRIGNGELYDASRQGNAIRFDYESEGKDKDITVPLSCDFLYNGKFTDFSLALVKELIKDKTGEIRIVNQRNFNTLIVTAYETLIVEGTSQNTRTITGKYGERIVLPDWEYEENYVRITEDGTEVSFAEISRGDILMVARTGGYVEIKIVNHSIAGIVSKINNDKFSVDGVDYEYSPFYKNTAKSSTHKIEPGLEATFFFDEYGKVVDFDDENVVYPGEYVFLVAASKKKQAFDYECKVRYVTMNAEMQTVELADKVKQDIGGSNVDASVVIDSITGKRELVYIEKNKDGKISKLLTDGSRLVSKDAVEKLRKYKRSSGAFLVDANDANFPEFFTNDATVAIQVPVSTASVDDFMKEDNYKKITLSAALKDAEEVIVEAYNFDDFTCPEVVLLRKAMVADTTLNERLHLVTGFGKVLNDEGEALPTVHTWSNGAEQVVVLADEAVMNCAVGDSTRTMTEGDVVRFFYNNSGNAFANEWVNNVKTGFSVSIAPVGRNNGNAYVVGTVEDRNERFIKIKLSGGNEMVCLPATTTIPTVYYADSGKAEGGLQSDLIKGDLVMFRIFYTSVQDIIVKK